MVPLPGDPLTSILSCCSFLANSLRTSLLSKIAAKEPLTILGDMGEFASRSEVPKLGFFLVSRGGRGAFGQLVGVTNFFDNF